MAEQSQPAPELQPEDFQKAVAELDSYIDITLDDLMHINRLAHKHARLRQTDKLMVRDIMTRDVVTVAPDTPLREAARLLLERRISGLPVTDANNQVVGIVTEADFLCALGIPCHHPAHNLWQTLEAMFRHQPRIQAVPATVADIMVSRVVTIDDDKTLHDAIDQMKRHYIKRLIVTNEHQQLQGIITRSNLVKVLLAQML